MKVGDLVEHIFISKGDGRARVVVRIGLGVIVKTPECTNNGNYLVYFERSKKKQYIVAQEL